MDSPTALCRSYGALAFLNSGLTMIPCNRAEKMKITTNEPTTIAAMTPM